MNQKYNGTEIAVIGMSGQFPGASSIEEFWENLKNGVESIDMLTDEELLEEGESRANIQHPNYVKANAYVKDKQYFDADFFGYRPSEAKLLDPQIRLFHENCWKTIEDAGYDSSSDLGKIGLFAGGSQNLNWENYCLIANQQGEVDDYTASQLRNITFLCSKTSYLLNLKGPSVYLNTACSTSLIAIQKACSSLLLRECNMALAGGVSIRNASKKGYFYQEGMIASSDGHCRPFDANSTGTVGGEGVGVILLKRLSDALKDHDNIHAIIKGYGANNDGHDKISYTAPSVEGESNAIRKAVSMARIEPESVTFVEAHGTGTKMGDPIEIEALKRVFPKTNHTCYIGSLKANVGHMNEAAGVSGVIKVIMALKNKQIPPNINFQQINPSIDLSDTSFHLNSGLVEWKNEQYPLRAGVSSFGIGGTNAHIILEEAPEKSVNQDEKGSFILKISGKTIDALNRNVKNLADYLQSELCSNTIQDISYTLDIGRADFPYRQAIVASDKAEAVDLLKVITTSNATKIPTGKRNVVFMFPGQGSQYVNMGLGLYSDNSVFKNELDSCFRIATDECGVDLKSIVFPSENFNGSFDINSTIFTQPVLFCFEYALAKTLIKSGITPDYLVGHSIGEYVAATISGVFDLNDALRLVIKRGELIQSLEKGSMLAIPLTEEKVLDYISQNPQLSIAALNHDHSTVVSGAEDTIAGLKERLLYDGVESKKLVTSHAFHSHMMDEILDAFLEELQKTTFHPVTIPFNANLTGERATDELVGNAEYWAKQLRNAVRFDDSVKDLLSIQNAVFIECGPGKTLCSFVRSNKSYSPETVCVHLMRHPSELIDDQRVFLGTLGKLWCSGLSYNNGLMDAEKMLNRVQLPTYSFEKQPFPVIVDAFKLITMKGLNGSIQKNNPDSWYYIPTWQYAPLELAEESFHPKNIVVFSDDQSIVRKAEALLQNASCNLFFVAKGPAFRQLKEGQFELDLFNDTQCAEFVHFMNNSGFPVDMVIYDHIGVSADASFKPELTNSILNTLQAFQRIDANTKRTYVLLTSEICNQETENWTFGLTQHSALLKVASQENPGVMSSFISVNPETTDETTFLNQLAKEIVQIQPGKEVLLKHGTRWERIYKKLTGLKATESSQFDDGIYFLTGGLGKLNVFIADQLLKNSTGRVAIAGRKTSFSPISEDHEKNKSLRQLEKHSDRFMYLSADVTKEEEILAAVGIIEQKWGAITGIFHTSGLTNGDSFQTFDKLSASDFSNQNAPKVEGLRVLAGALGQKDVKFCIATSSISSILGGINFAAYASANMLMENYLLKERLEGRLTNWTIASLDGLNFDQDRSEGIDLSDLWDVLKVCIQNKANPVTVVSITELQSRIERWVIGKETTSTNDTIDESLFIENLDENLDTSLTEQRIIRLWERFFGKENLSVTDDFFELGGDSLGALTMIGSIYKHLNTQLTITDFFNRPTIEALAEFIDMQNWMKANNNADKKTKTEIIL